MRPTPARTNAAPACDDGVLNDGFTHHEVIGPESDGASVLAHLAGRWRHSSADAWAIRIARGEIRLDGSVAAADDGVRAGQRLTWDRPPWREPRVPLDFAVLHVDDDVLAVAKPRGLPTAPAGGFLRHTLLAVVQRRHAGAVPVHRLGRGTSGVVLFARSARARRALPAAWRADAVTRVYVARVVGRPAHARFAIDRPIGPVPHPLLGTVHAACDDGRPARTDVTILRAGDETTLVAVTIATGRPHQIRIHLAAAGHPLAGDPLYGPDGVPAADARALPGDGGYLLHAARITFPHPASGVATTVACGWPAGLRTPV